MGTRAWLTFLIPGQRPSFFVNDILLHLDSSAIALGKSFGSHRWPFIFFYMCLVSFLGCWFGNFADGSCWMYSGTSSPVCFLFCFHRFGCLISISCLGFLFLFLGHKIGRHLVLGTGNGAKTSCTLLIIRFYYAGQVWDGYLRFGYMMQC